MTKYEEIADFARFYGFHYDGLSKHALVRDFLVDMKRGLSGVPTALPEVQPQAMPMLPSYLRPASHCTPGKTVLALDAGGTNLRVSRVKFDVAGKAVAEGSKKVAMPGTYGHLSADEFFDALADVAAPVIKDAGGAENLGGIGFCFSYAMEMTPDGDGIPLIFSKELDIPDVVGKPVGAGLRAALEKKGIAAPKRIVLLNDTVSTLLTGVTAIEPRMPNKQIDGKACSPDVYGVEPGPVVGLILGTGFNTAYPEMSIPKIGFSAKCAKDAMVVVTESGNYFNRHQGRLDREFDATTKNPGSYTTEKALSGAYLGPLCLHIFKQAVKDGLVAFDKQNALLEMETLQTRDLNTFLHNPVGGDTGFGALFGKGDRELDAITAINSICAIVNERAAIFSAAVTAGTAIKTGGGSNPLSPVRIAVEGTTYLLYAQIRRSFEAHLHQMLCANEPFHYQIEPVQSASLIGAAVAALS
jgi:hexokinase